MGYEDIVIFSFTIPPNIEMTYWAGTNSRITSSHVLLTESIHSNITDDVTWETNDSGVARIYFASKIRLSEDTPITLVFGAPV